jgi:predicted  nucleic acid-binding Zn-ribbon protein
MTVLTATFSRLFPAADYERELVDKYNKALEKVKKELEGVQHRHALLQQEYHNTQREISARAL